MDFTLLPALAGFALVATITPGPNNLMVLASGVNFGFRRTIPHLLGITTGATIAIMLIGVGLMILFDVLPWLQAVLTAASIIYLLFLAWKIANAAPVDNETSGGRPLTFFQAAAFQWINPKVWASGMTVITLYAPEHALVPVLIVGLTFAVIGLPANSIWAGTGTILQRWLSSGSRLRVFNFLMALLLVASLYPVLSQ